MAVKKREKGMTELSLENQNWHLETGEVLDTREIFARLVGKKIEKSLLCWNEEEREKQPIKMRFNVIGKYAILKTIGEGVFGRVYLGFDAERREDGKTGRLVAIKAPTRSLLKKYAQEVGKHKDKEKGVMWAKLNIGELFSKEAILTANLGMSKNVISVLDHSISHPFIVLEYCNGGTLKDRLQSPYNEEQVYKWGFDIASALEAAHNLQPNKLIHRDLKPANLLLHNNEVKVSDFGTSKFISETESLKTLHGGYTPSYAAPEAYDGKVYEATDIWSFGVILYEIISGKLPFSGGSMIEMMKNIALETPTPLPKLNGLKVDEPLYSLVEKCLAKDPTKRPTAKECRKCLEKLVGREAPQETAPSSKNRSKRIREITERRKASKSTTTPNWEKLGVATVLTLLILIGAGLLFKFAKPNKSGTIPNKTVIKNREISGFTYLRKGTYSAGGQTNTVNEYKHNKTGIEFALIPGGSFMMGRTGKLIHHVNVEEFLLSKHEVTQGKWKKIMGTIPWAKKNNVRKGKNYPATYVSWNKVKKFCAKTGLSLPSEAQWEYACRSGTTTKYYWGNNMDGNYAWYYDNATAIGEGYPHEVGRKKPNAFGLYDMSGNVYEWCEDKWHNDYTGAPSDDRAWSIGSSSDYVHRGGGGRCNSSYCQSAYRRQGEPNYSSNDLGFRVAFRLNDEAEKSQQINKPREITGLKYLRSETYFAGDQTHTVDEYLQEETGIEFVLITGGNFMMGSNNGNGFEKPIHKVSVKEFLISKYEISQELWEKFMGNNPSFFKGKNRPVENVSWENVKEFCSKLGLRLPSEAEWEYACRSGTKTDYYWGDTPDDDYMHYAQNNKGGSTKEIGSKKPNAFGLYDMSGNVWEWCEDRWHDNYLGAPNKSITWSTGNILRFVARGGSWHNSAPDCRSSRRSGGSPKARDNDIGFRVCLKNIKEIPGFRYLQSKTYSEGGQTQIVDEYQQDQTQIEFVLIPGGSFIMGSDHGLADEKPVHKVTVKAFLMGKYEVTQGQWQRIMGTNSLTTIQDNKPIERVLWSEAKEFCQKIGLNLPSEAQWEYACRGGTTTKYYWGNQWDRNKLNSASYWAKQDLMNIHEYKTYDFGNKILSLKAGLKEVGSFPPNPFGLHDILGNVWEWCEDDRHNNYFGAPITEKAWKAQRSVGKEHRGGAWDSHAGSCRVTARGLGSPHEKKGFRVVFNLDNP